MGTRLFTPEQIIDYIRAYSDMANVLSLDRGDGYGSVLSRTQRVGISKEKYLEIIRRYRQIPKEILKEIALNSSHISDLEKACKESKEILE